MLELILPYMRSFKVCLISAKTFLFNLQLSVLSFNVSRGTHCRLMASVQYRKSRRKPPPPPTGFVVLEA